MFDILFFGYKQNCLNIGRFNEIYLIKFHEILNSWGQVRFALICSFEDAG